jgi:hypothetical protein
MLLAIIIILLNSIAAKNHTVELLLKHLCKGHSPHNTVVQVTPLYEHYSEVLGIIREKINVREKNTILNDLEL